MNSHEITSLDELNTFRNTFLGAAIRNALTLNTFFTSRLSPAHRIVHRSPLNYKHRLPWSIRARTIGHSDWGIFHCWLSGLACRWGSMRGSVRYGGCLYPGISSLT